MLNTLFKKDFEEITKLEKYGFKIKGRLISFKSGFLQTLTIKTESFYRALKHLCILKEKVSLKKIKTIDSKISLNQFQIKINEKQNVCLNLFCETTFTREKMDLENIDLFFDNGLLSLAFMGSKKEHGIYITEIIDVEMINN